MGFLIIKFLYKVIVHKCFNCKVTYFKVVLEAIYIYLLSDVPCTIYLVLNYNLYYPYFPVVCTVMSLLHYKLSVIEPYHKLSVYCEITQKCCT